MVISKISHISVNIDENETKRYAVWYKRKTRGKYVSYESFIENPIETFVDFNNLGDITVANIGDDMTQDQKEKAQEVVVPVILTRIASMAAFMFRRS